MEIKFGYQNRAASKKFEKIWSRPKIKRQQAFSF